MRNIRFLLPWLPRDEAVATFLGRAPIPADNVGEYAARWEAASQVLQAREAFHIAAPRLEDLPGELTERANAFRQRADVLAAFQGLDWTLGIADLNSVLSYQKTVAEDHALDRVSGIERDDLQALFSVCLPDPAAAMNLELAVDPDHKGLTFFSANPNLRFGGHAVQQTAIPAAPGQAAWT